MSLSSLILKESFSRYRYIIPPVRINKWALSLLSTGVIISYNTQAPGTTGSPVLLPGAFCINPLNWTTEETPANKLLNLGAVFFNDTTSHIEREILHYAGAWVDPETGALVTRVPEELDIGSFPPGVYHRYDYALWYRNLQANVKARCEKYLEQVEK